VEVEDTEDPTWETEPMNQFAELGQLFSYQVTAIDPSGISEYEIVGNASFTISSVGLITNATNLDSLDDYTFEVYAYDPYYNQLTKTITVTVRDTTNPLIDSAPSDLEFNEDDTGISVEWTASDLQLAGYEIYIDGDLLYEDTIDGTSVEISISLDDLTEGLYNITIVFYDSSGNEASDIVWVTVSASTITTTPSTTTNTNTTSTTEPLDPLVVLTVGTGGAIAVVIVLVVFAKKKSG
jgi:hypothetical protein